jgi:8-oxo-dGTP pyrophosphatase MutT (NUDIX family)
MTRSAMGRNAELITALREVCEPVGAQLAAPPKSLAPASVLLIIDTTSPDLPILFVVRSNRVSTHRGQVAFPGGSQETGETPIKAALREAQEEVGLPLDGVQVLGTLPALPTVSDRWLTPVVALSDRPWQVIPDGFEVADWFWAPLRDVVNAHHYTRTFEHDGSPHEVHFFDVGEHTVWGATGAIVAELLQRLSRQLPAQGVGFDG